ncbi:MAG: phenylacetate--CoA ligase [Clostridia bacterium]|nr:phenylacetate--CoA ligase [Clostridia bacterium]
MENQVWAKLQELVERVTTHSPFYRERLGSRKVNSLEEFYQIPYTDKADLREAYPLGLMAVPQKQVVRIHSSSGTTGKPVIIPYTRRDVETWAMMFSRCFAMAGITDEDVVQVTPGYGLWTAGIGFQAGAEHLGAMVIPMGPGNTEKQIQMLLDLKTTVLCATASYALLLAEEVGRRNLNEQIHLKRGIIGSELWGDLMRGRIAEELGIELFDIYGLTEVYGPGIGVDCSYHTGIHYWDDQVYFDIIDPETGEPVPDGQLGELVISTFHKEAAPVLRYRTHDITCLIPGQCPCGSPHKRIGRIMGRTDDMIKVKGVNIYPGQITDALRNIEGLSSEYQVHIDHLEGKDQMLLKVERKSQTNSKELEAALMHYFKSKVGLTIKVETVEIGALPRSEKKSQRVFDYRQK